MRRREPFCFVAFDLLAVNGRDMHKLSLIDWKQILREIVPEESRSISSRSMFPGTGAISSQRCASEISRGHAQRPAGRNAHLRLAEWRRRLVASRLTHPTLVLEQIRRKRDLLRDASDVGAGRNLGEASDP